MGPITLFVTGTGSGVGKTLAACGLIIRLRMMEVDALGVKPVDTNAVYRDDHDLMSPDGTLLAAASGGRVMPLDACPYRMNGGGSPAAAAERRGLDLNLEDLRDAIAKPSDEAEAVIVEGAGGALTPTAKNGCVIDLAALMRSTVLIVSDLNDPVSNTGLVLEACRNRGINIGGVLLSQGSAVEEPDDLDDVERLVREHGGALTFPTLPSFAGDDERRVADTANHFKTHRIAEALLDAAKRP